MGLSADVFTDTIKALMHDPRVWGAFLAIALIIGFVAMLAIWAKKSQPESRDIY